MDNIRLLVDMGWSIEIKNSTFSVSITISKLFETMTYDGTLHISDPSNTYNLIAGKILVNLYKELFEEANKWIVKVVKKLLNLIGIV